MTEPLKMTERHFTAFGGITHIFAKIELLLQATTATLAGVDLTTAILFTTDLGYRGKRDCVLSFTNIKRPDLLASLKPILNRIDSKSKIRNHIAHSIWCPGHRAESIKPIGIARGGTSKLYGVSDDEKDWTLQELWQESVDIELLHGELLTFLDKSGLLTIIERKIDETISKT